MSFLDAIFCWLRANRDNIVVNIVAGIVASFIVLALQTTVTSLSLALAAVLTLKWRLRLLWRLRNPKRIYVVSGEITGVSEAVQSVVLAGCDAEAANALIATSGLLYPDAEIKHVYSSRFIRDFYKEHLVVIGGPVNNTCSRAILANVTDLSFKDFQIVVGSETFETQYDENNNALVDFGALLRITNPFDEAKDVILVVGCDTYGVLAAASILTSRPEMRGLRSLLEGGVGIGRYFARRNFVAVVECDVLGNEIGNIRIKITRMLK